jgi:Flp pilus assembly protein TadD
MNKKIKYCIIIFLVAASFIAFGRITGNNFINFDDGIYISENNYIKSGINLESIKWAFTSSHATNWHPLTWLSHMLDWQLFGANAAGHHLVNLLLHIGSAILLFLFLNKTTGSLWRSAFVAALFALHPLRVESVAWASERKDVLSMFLGLSSIYAYAYYIESSKLSRYFIALILFALSLMAKPMLVTLPFVLLLLDYWPLGRWQKALQPGLLPVSNDSGLVKKKGKQLRVDSGKEKKISLSLMSRAKIIRSLLWEKGPFIFLSTVSSILTIWAQSKGGAVASLEKLPLIDRILNAIVSYIQYLMKIFWPVDLAVFYTYRQLLPSWQVFGAAAFILGISIAVIYAIKKAPFLFVGWFWYLGTLIPVIGLMQVGNQSIADRYTYFPSIGIAIILAWGIGYLLPKGKLSKIILIPAAVIIFAVLTFLTWQQCGYWKNSISLFTHVVQATKDNYLAHNSLGAALAAEGKNKEAIVHYREAFEINPTSALALTNLCMNLIAEGKNEEAIAYYLAAIQVNPDHFEAHYNLAEIFVKQNKLDQAIEHFRETVRIIPSSFSALNNLGVNLEKQLKHDEAIYYYRKAVLIEPQNPGIYFNLGVSLGNKGEIKEAITNFRQASNLKPDYEEARRALKLALELNQQK